MQTRVRRSWVNSKDSFFSQKSTQIFRNLDYFLLKQIDILRLSSGFFELLKEKPKADQHWMNPARMAASPGQVNIMIVV